MIKSFNSSPVTPTSTNRVNTLFQSFLRQRISFVKPVLGTTLGTILIFLKNAHFRGFVRIPKNLPFGAELRAVVYYVFLRLGDELITLTVTPDEGYRLRSLTVIDSNGRELTVTNNQFELSEADVTVIMEFEKLTGGYISGANLSLRGEISVNLFIRPFPELGDDAYVMVKGPNDAQPRKVILDDSIYRSDKQAYLVSAPVYAAQMGENAEFTLFNSAGEPQQLWNASGQNFYMGICIKQGGISAMQPAAALTLCVSLL